MQVLSSGCTCLFYLQAENHCRRLPAVARGLLAMQILLAVANSVRTFCDNLLQHIHHPRVEGVSKSQNQPNSAAPGNARMLPSHRIARTRSTRRALAGPQTTGSLLLVLPKASQKGDCLSFRKSTKRRILTFSRSNPHRRLM